MDNRFYNGFEKKAAIRETLTKVKNFMLGKKAPGKKITAPDIPMREVAPRGSVIMPPKKVRPTRKDPKTLDYGKINADVRAKAEAKRKHIRESGSTIDYSNRMGSPVVTSA